MYEQKLADNDVVSHLYFQYDLAGLIQTASEITDNLAQITELDELFDKTVRFIQKSLGYDQVILYILDSKQKQFNQKVIATAKQSKIVHSYLLKDEITLAIPAAQYNHTVRINNLPAEAPNYYHPEPLDIHSELHIPLSRSNYVLGVLSMGQTAPNGFADDNVVVVLKTVAVQIAVMIERIRQVRRNTPQPRPILRSARLERDPTQEYSLENIVPGIQSLAGIQEVFDRIVRGVVDGLGYTATMLAVVDEEKQTLPVQAIAANRFIQELDLIRRVENKLKIQIIGKAASLIHDKGNLGVQSCLSGEAKISHDLYDLFQPAVNPQLSGWIQRISRVKTCISIPLLVEDKVVGNLYAGTKKGEISKKDIKQLRFFVTNAAIAVQNSILYEQLNQRLTWREAELNQLRGIEKMIHSSLDLREVLTRILHGALELTQAEYGQVILTGSYASDLVNQVSYPDTPDFPLTGRLGLTELIMKDKKPRLINNTELLRQNTVAVDSVAGDLIYLSEQLKSRIGVPISLGDELIGVINIASQEPGAFDQQSLALVEQIAIQAAIAIRNAYQFKTEREMRERMVNASQVVAMGDMASNMVHSINNWVGSIRADINYLKSQQDNEALEPAVLTEILDDMLVNAESTLTMAENIRRPFQSITPEPIDVNTSILTVLRQMADKLTNVLVIQDLNELPSVWATQQLELVFENLITNGLQAMEGQEQVIIRICTRRSTDKQWVEIVIQDSGPGLDSIVDEIDIFKLGVSSKKEGLGYGLWWCDTFLKRWGGKIHLTNNSQTGCEFTIKLPNNIKTLN